MSYSAQTAGGVGVYFLQHVNALAASAVAVGHNINTTSATTIAAGNDVAVTLASAAGVEKDMWLHFCNGTGTAEAVRVKTVNLATNVITADFTYAHSGAYNVISSRGTFIGHLVVNQTGSADIRITLYNGHPSLLPDAGTVIGVINPNSTAPNFEYDGIAHKGLWYTIAGTTIGDYTFCYKDMSA